MHVAIIMDGNGRWATQRGLPRTAGHIEGAKAVSTTVEAAARASIDTLTLYAFSSANWLRPDEEVSGLMRLFRRYLFMETRRCIEHSIRINVIGRRDRLSAGLLYAIEQSEQRTAEGTGMHLRMAVDYSAQQSIVAAAHLATSRRASSCAHQPRDLTRDDFQRLLHEVDHSALPSEECDLLIRTGGEKRLSDFLLWECAYAELHFTDCLWPDFTEQHFQRALADYATRQRRFGALPHDPNSLGALS